MTPTQVYKGTWEELARQREHYGDHRLMLTILPDDPEPDDETASDEKPRPRFGSGKGIFRMAHDFDAPLEDFREYME